MPVTGIRHDSDSRPSGRFPSSQRVRKRSEFREIQASGRRVVTAHFVLLFWAREVSADRSGARIGLTVSRRVGNAVVRNRGKRLLREAFRATRDLWPEDLDLVVIVKRLRPDMRLVDVVSEWRHAERTIRRRLVEARKDREKRQQQLAQED